MKKRFVNIVALLLFFLGFVWYLSSNWSNFQEISLSHPISLIPAIIFSLTSIYSMGSLLEIAIEPHGVKLSKNEVFGLSSLTRFGNYISPGYLGAAIRAIYLKKNYGINYTKFSSSFVVSNILQFIISGVLILSIYSLRTGTLTNSFPILIIFLSVVVFFSLLYAPLSRFSIFSKYIKNSKNKYLERMLNGMEQFDKVKSHPGLLYRMVIWMIISIVSSSVILFSLYHALGVNIEIIPAIFIASIGNWAIIFSITPASIGVREGLMALGARLMEVSIPATLAVAVVLRLVMFLVISGLSSYYAPKLLNTTLTKLKSLSS